MVDRRIVRTRELLFDALLDLMIEKGYEAITVQDLINKANIGRSTFYAHFQDKDHLLSENIKNLKQYLTLQRITYIPAEETHPLKFTFSMGMFQHAQSHKRIYKAVAGKHSGIKVIFEMKNMLAELVTEEIETRHAAHIIRNIPLSIVVEFVVNTFFSLLTWWKESKTPCSVIEIDEMFHQLALSGIRG